MIDLPPDDPRTERDTEPSPIERLQAGDFCGYQITDAPHYLFVVGVPKGRKRPALFTVDTTTGKMTILAQFHGLDHAAAMVGWMDGFVGQVGRVIQHIKRTQSPGDTTP